MFFTLTVSTTEQFSSSEASSDVCDVSSYQLMCSQHDSFGTQVMLAMSLWSSLEKDHCKIENHVMDWEEVKIIVTEDQIQTLDLRGYKDHEAGLSYHIPRLRSIYTLSYLGHFIPETTMRWQAWPT